MKLYLAGPDVFRPDPLAWADEARALCARFGHQALIPLDGDATTATGIYQANIAMIGEADAVLANLNPFRGAEPDSGTAFEVGYALALGKPVWAYLARIEPIVDRVARLQGEAARPEGAAWLDRDGWRIEDFGLPLNLMLAVPARVVAGDLAAVLRALPASHVETGEEPHPHD